MTDVLGVDWRAPLRLTPSAARTLVDLLLADDAGDGGDCLGPEPSLVSGGRLDPCQRADGDGAP